MIRERLQINYKALIPKRLHIEVEKLLAYLDFFPFEKPNYCHYCESSNIYATGFYSRPNKQLPIHYCTDCKKSFNQLTNTIFSRSWHLEQWGYVGRLYLAGTSVNDTARLTGISKRPVFFRFKAINQLMKDYYPELYLWWHNHRERLDLSFSNIPEKQAALFIKWLEELITKQDYTCPHCHQQLYKANYQSRRPQFVCYHCNFFFNPINNTPFKKMHHIDLWVAYARVLCEGYSNYDIEKLIGINHKLAQRWRAVFIKQMQELKLNELVQWLTWQRQRRYAQVTKITKWVDSF